MCADRRRARGCALFAVLGTTLLVATGSAPADVLPPVKPCTVTHTFEPRLTYVTDLESVRPTTWAASPDGSHPVRLGTGTYSATVSHDGGTVAVVTPQSGTGSALVVVPSHGGPFQTLLHTDGSFDQVTWSDSGWLAAVVDDRRLVVFDPRQHAMRTIARGSIAGVSFAPGDCSDRLVYGRAASAAPTARVDLYAATVDGAHTQQLTHDGRSLDPVWGPGQIAYSHERLRRGATTAYQLWLADADGRHAHQLTHVRPSRVEYGLTATAWSGDGRRLLAGFTGLGLGGVDEAWTVDVPSGRARDLTGRFDDVAGAGLSRDGRTVLVERGAAKELRKSVETIPWRGGRAHVLVRNGGAPSWNR